MWIFSVEDKSGRNIHLSKERFAHIQKHPEIVNNTERIIETLQNPDVITTLESDEQVKFYFKYYKDHRQYLFISVKYLNGDGFIITSFYTDKIQ
ncbi:hypothetical protein HYX14_06615 [Candidatus Woesearchaeota archaeon]|nr:hypothetical protein [Candidatus Woesearchaeota archaeon]